MRVPDYTHQMQMLVVPLTQDLVRLDGDKFTKRLQVRIIRDVKKGVLMDPFDYELELMHQWWRRCGAAVTARGSELAQPGHQTYKELLAAVLKVRPVDLPLYAGQRQTALNRCGARGERGGK